MILLCHEDRCIWSFSCFVKQKRRLLYQVEIKRKCFFKKKDRRESRKEEGEKKSVLKG